MIPRVRSAGIALCAVLAVASPCLAAEGMAPGRGAIGGQLGGSSFWADADYSEGSRSRLAFSGHYRYVINSRLRWQVSPGFTWSGYSGTVPAANRPLSRSARPGGAAGPVVTTRLVDTCRTPP